MAIKQPAKKPLAKTKNSVRKRRVGVRKHSDPTPDPLENVEYTDNLEEDSARELTALEQAYRQRAKNETKRFYDATDSEFWFAVSFQNREEKEKFLQAVGLKINTKYITGDMLADALGITY